MRRSGSVAVLAGLILAAAISAQQPRQRPTPAPSAADCTFRHPQLPGQCNVTVAIEPRGAPRTTCESVLRCINGLNCREADAYCPNPGVPRSWRLEEAVAARPRAQCAYANPSYSGWCRLTVPVLESMTPASACEAVLPCLNGAPCEGYIHFCDPEIRAGWTLVEVRGVRPPSPTPVPKR